MSPDSRAAQSTVLLATLSTGSGVEPRGCADPETLGDGICNANTVACERVAKRVFFTIDLTNSTPARMFVHLYIRIFAIFCARDGVLSVLGRKGCSPPHTSRFVPMVVMS